jgi:hypothetical protein
MPKILCLVSIQLYYVWVLDFQELSKSLWYLSSSRKFWNISSDTYFWLLGRNYLIYLKLKSPWRKSSSIFCNKTEILAHSEMNLVKIGTLKNRPGQTPPASQNSANLINYTQIYALLCFL